MKTEDISSGYENDHIAPSGAIDFSLAQKLERGGSTCDVYVTRYHRRRVFIKRLKEEFRFSPQHVAAFDKEYDIGVSLKHKSLPEYREFHDDYLVIDYVEGVTLADMIADKDTWLTKEKNVRNMLVELIDVIDYLHQHNVVHCDIKPDNILMTHGTRNLVLIDLDKAYTSWLDDTAGDAHLYGADITGSPDIDFRGVGMIVEQLSNRIPGFPARKFKKFHDECLRNGTTPDVLRDRLAKPDNKIKYGIMISALTVISVTIFFYVNTPINDEAVGSPIESTTTVTPVKDTVVISNEQVAVPVVKEVVRETIQEETAKNEGYKEIIAREMPSRIKPMEKIYREADALITDTTATSDQLYDFIYVIIEVQYDISMKAYADYEKLYPDEAPVDVQNAVNSCKAYTEMLRKNDEIVQRLSDEIARRK